MALRMYGWTLTVSESRSELGEGALFEQWYFQGVKCSGSGDHKPQGFGHCIIRRG